MEREEWIAMGLTPEAVERVLAVSSEAQTLRERCEVLEAEALEAQALEAESTALRFVASTPGPGHAAADSHARANAALRAVVRR